jgi:phenylpropionate dioxygenase-like ring-hydroxylating dioxygenase large terminal subunit
MNSNIPAFHYFNEGIFSQENEKIFSQLWHFVGFKSDFLNENDFVTIKIADVPVVIQNVRGCIKSFLNVCSV